MQQEAPPDLLLAALALFDLDHLPAVVPAAAWADVMRSFELLAVPASDEVNRGKKDVPAPIALAVAADALFRQRSHVSPRSGALAPWRAIGH
jgi:hypothetical protein